MSNLRFKRHGFPFTVLLFAILLIIVSGCQMFEPEKVGPPMGYREQISEIRRIVAIGTPRETTIEKLKAAGIEGEYSRVAKSIFYCHSWKRPNGARMQMTVSLLFDEKDKFYAVDLRQASPHEEQTGNRTATRSKTGGLHRKRSGTSSSVGSTVPWPDDKLGRSAPKNVPTDSRNDRRTPFGDQ